MDTLMPAPRGEHKLSATGIESEAQAHGRQGQVDEHDVGPGLGHFSFPSGITVEGATLRGGGGNGEFFHEYVALLRAAPAAQKWGSLPPPYSSPVVHQPSRATRGAPPPEAQGEIHVIPCPMRLLGETPNHNGEGNAL